MKLPRNVTGRQLISYLRPLGYEVVRQTGSHVYLTTEQGGKHHLCIPDHHPLRIGSLNKILKQTAEHHKLSRVELLEQLFP